MKVKFSDLEIAFSDSGNEFGYWVDKQTGRVLLIGDEFSLGEIDYPEEEAESVREIKILSGDLDAEEGIEIDEDRYVEIEPPDSDEQWRWMEKFALTRVENEKLQDKLLYVLRGRKPFLRFKDALFDYPDDRQRWFDFQNGKLCEAIENWAESEGLEIDFGGKER
jgi:hypothetical protein